MRLDEVLPAKDERLFVVGQTGTGKSALTEAICLRLLEEKRWLVVNDSKGEFFGHEGLAGADVVTKLSALPGCRGRLIQLRLPMKEQTEENWDRFYGWCFERRNCTVVTDELAMVMENGIIVPDGFRECACQGRSRNISMISLAQRPASIPVVARSEASKYVVFELAMRDDRKSVAEFMGRNGQEVIDIPASGHSFYYYNKSEKKLHYLQLNEDMVRE